MLLTDSESPIPFIEPQLLHIPIRPNIQMTLQARLPRQRRLEISGGHVPRSRRASIATGSISSSLSGTVHPPRTPTESEMPHDVSGSPSSARVASPPPGMGARYMIRSRRTSFIDGNLTDMEESPSSPSSLHTNSESPVPTIRGSISTPSTSPSMSLRIGFSNAPVVSSSLPSTPRRSGSVNVHRRRSSVSVLRSIPSSELASIVSGNTGPNSHQPLMSVLIVDGYAK
ncbi:hypothetical protein BC937DRAFT_93612 [Endogone sp. FLAS-F59071]|nr:hypothetical protein BC937DRAFT_93612 [Endogone sp. FLAS-F59071]|eukprot:RUS14580.1 hypothetical protein BC937DRAFT_93612 [Endogone sp. FLAS-F59071]